MSLADIITLRPEIQLCYVGISTKCFEIMETKLSEAPGLGNGLLNDNIGPVNPVNGHPNIMDQPPAEVDEATDDDENDTVDDDADSQDDSQDEGTPTSPTDPDETQSEDQHPSDEDSDDDSFMEPVAKARLRLREILFYDDKVAIFKARHGRL